MLFSATVVAPRIARICHFTTKILLICQLSIDH